MASARHFMLRTLLGALNGRDAAAPGAAPVAPVPEGPVAGNGVDVLAAEPLPPDEEPEEGRRLSRWLALALVLLLLGGGIAAYLLTRPATVTVPPVTGESLSVASTQLQNAGFVVSTLNVTSSHPAGFVIRQDPVGDTEAKKGSTVDVHYTGWLYDPGLADKKGRKFDSSLDRGSPFSFPLGGGRVIRGWDEGVAGMRVGGRRTLVIPPEMAYGSRGAGGVIPPDATLIFEVELVAVRDS